MTAAGRARRTTGGGSSAGERLQPATRSRTDVSSAGGLSGPAVGAGAGVATAGAGVATAGAGEGIDSVVRRLFARRVGERSEVRFLAIAVGPAAATVTAVEAAAAAAAVVATAAKVLAATSISCSSRRRCDSGGGD